MGKNKVLMINREDEKNYGYTGIFCAEIAGNFQAKSWVSYDVGILFFLDDFDKKLVENIPLKKGEIIYRYQTDNMKIMGMKSLIKVNVEKGLVYFLTELSCEDDRDILFEKRGIYVNFLNIFFYYNDKGVQK